MTAPMNVDVHYVSVPNAIVHAYSYVCTMKKKKSVEHIGSHFEFMHIVLSTK